MKLTFEGTDAEKREFLDKLHGVNGVLGNLPGGRQSAHLAFTKSIVNEVLPQQKYPSAINSLIVSLVAAAERYDRLAEPEFRNTLVMAAHAYGLAAKLPGFHDPGRQIPASLVLMRGSKVWERLSLDQRKEIEQIILNGEETPEARELRHVLHRVLQAFTPKMLEDALVPF